MNNSIINFPLPANEPVKAYMPGSPERVALEKELERQSKLVVEIPIIIGGKEIRTGDMGEVTCPHDHKHVIARYHKVGKKVASRRRRRRRDDGPVSADCDERRTVLRHAPV